MTSPCWLGGGRVAQVVLYRGPPICGQKTILERFACIKDEMLCWYLNQWYIDQWLKLLFNLPSSLLPGNSKHVIRKVVAEFQSLSYCSVVEEVTRKWTYVLFRWIPSLAGLGFLLSAILTVSKELSRASSPSPPWKNLRNAFTICRHSSCKTKVTTFFWKSETYRLQ